MSRKKLYFLLTPFSFGMSNTNDGKCVNWCINIDSPFTWYEVHLIMRKTEGKREYVLQSLQVTVGLKSKELLARIS